MIISRLLQLLTAVLLTASLLLSCNQKAPENHAGQVYVELKPVQTDSGWGYEIYVNDTLYIKQKYIPTISGNHAFKSQEDATKAGKLVMTKLKHGKIPTLTQDELKEMNIIQ